MLIVDKATPSPNDLHPSLHQLHSLITQPQYPTPGASQPHTCHFSGLILIPSPSYPNGPVGMIPPSTWADTLNTRLLTPVLTTQMFLPLMSSNKNNSSTIVLLTPSIPSSLEAPFNSPEVLVTRGLEGWASSLRRELLISSSNTTGSIDVVQLKVGHIDLEPTMCRSTSTEMLSWNPSRGSHSSSPKPLARRLPAQNTGSPVTVLHNAVFDAVAMNTRSGRIYRKRRRVVYVGKGSWTYSIIGSWAPGGLVGWMLGFGVGHGVWRTGDESRSEGWEKV
jgi:NAD(P)-dependent dehydrogenase (short-subunit alcohol dehydrogenase family)